MDPVDLAALLPPERIVLDAELASRAEVIDAVGGLLVLAGAPASLVPAMHEREARISTYIGDGVALPHASPTGHDGAGAHGRDALALVRVGGGVEWDDERAHVAIGLAVDPARHVAVLAALAAVLMDPERARALREENDPELVRAALRGADTPVPTSPAPPGGQLPTDPESSSPPLTTSPSGETRGEDPREGGTARTGASLE